MQQIIVLIPAFMPNERFVSFSRSLMKKQIPMLVVDDGSTGASRNIFTEVESLGIPIVHHKTNLGKGAAIKTGIKEIQKRWPLVTGIITADCDGQHNPDDIERMMERMKQAPDTLIIGRRNLQGNIPFRSRLGNTLTRLLYQIFTGNKILDTQSGMRGLPASLFASLLALEGARYDYEMNMLLQIKNWGISYSEVPIKTIYYDNNAGTHYRAIRDSWLIMRQFLSLAAASLASFLVDYSIFILLSNRTGLEIATCYIIARVFSSFLNYKLNSKMIFKVNGYAAFIKYYILVLFIMVTGSLGTHFLSEQLGLNHIISKIAVDGILFLFSYVAQKKVIFSPQRKQSIDRM